MSQELPDMSNGEQCIAVYSGLGSVVYCVSVETLHIATEDSQDADLGVRLIGNRITPTLKLPRVSRTRARFVLGSTAQEQYYCRWHGPHLLTTWSASASDFALATTLCLAAT